MIRVRVPASSANMGPGFDTLGVALNLYNTLEISETDCGLEIINVDSTEYIPKDENNLVYRSMKLVFDTVGYTHKGIKISQKSDIPVTRGLGSSSACIIGGMLAANVISGRKLSYDNILDLAVKIEGHPDNLTPALYGGFCISMMDNDRVIYKSHKINSKMKFAVMIPNYFVATKKSRRVLPDKISYKDAVFNISHALMFASILSDGDLTNLKSAVEDKLHQPYRSSYIENMEDIFNKSYALGSKATYLSGSGPTILSILDGDYLNFETGMKSYFENSEYKWTCRILSIDNVGAVVKTI